MNGYTKCGPHPYSEKSVSDRRTNTHESMATPSNHYAEWKKPGTKATYIACDSIYINIQNRPIDRNREQISGQPGLDWDGELGWQLRGCRPAGLLPGPVAARLCEHTKGH